MQILFYNRYIFRKKLKLWPYGQVIYLFFYFFFLHLLLLDLQGNVAIIKSL